MHRFTVGDYLLQITKERMLLITSKRRMLQIKGKMVELVTLHTQEVQHRFQEVTLGICSKHLLPQSRVREFQQKQDSYQPMYNAGLIPHRRTQPRAWVLPAEPRSPLAFQSGSWATFPMLGMVPHIQTLFVIIHLTIKFNQHI